MAIINTTHMNVLLKMKSGFSFIVVAFYNFKNIILKFDLLD
jgi:hypothetical protein